MNRILKPRLEAFAGAKHFYLDSQKERPARTGKKVSWNDKYGNKHDLDFVIEVGGSETERGMPVAFIEAAWRRYTKHSKNKAQEIQGAILPIIELHHLAAPFYGAVLAGEFTDNALAQLRNNKFSVLYIPYRQVVDAFAAVGFDIEFDEDTSDKSFAEANVRLASLSDAEKAEIRVFLVDASKNETDKFMTALQATLERFIVQIILVPLFGTEAKCMSVEEALVQLGQLDKTKPNGSLQKIDVIVDYNNGDTIRASFVDEIGAMDFLSKLAG
ncbi:hypothetical protein [Massilia genomosp. 1]|uniref:hypothetical protein n=1 Tax=Massilia genomosp. 1 TaxID=2609280 RepID=UPI001E41A0CC|nr:hypothetical protein [Massilia genomosp. 1]